MGYYSQCDLDRCWSEDLGPGRLESLQMRLDDMQDRLAMLEDYRPRDPMDPMFDFYFYSDHIIEPYEIPDKAEGLLDAIRLLEEEIQVLQTQELKQELWLTAILGTGATPDGQLVLPIHMFSPYQLQMPAA